jgi:hypothetical protein
MFIESISFAGIAIGASSAFRAAFENGECN